MGPYLLYTCKTGCDEDFDWAMQDLHSSLPSWYSFEGAVKVLRGLLDAVAGAGAAMYFACLAATARPSLPNGLVREECLNMLSVTGC